MRKLIADILTVLAIICLAQLFFFGILTIARGYSIPSGVDNNLIAISGTFLLLIAQMISKEHNSLRIYLVNFIIFYVCGISSLQGRHLKEGIRLYNTGQYQAALAQFQKETNLWYLRLHDNSLNEAQSLHLIADTYGRLSQFDKVIPVYKLIAQRYPGHNANFALSIIESLSEYQKWIGCTPSDPNDFSSVAAAYQMYNCPQKAIMAYQQLIDSNVAHTTKTMAQEHIAELRDPNSFYNRLRF